MYYGKKGFAIISLSLVFIFSSSLVRIQADGLDAGKHFSETDVKPPVLDKPGMADELICVNFDQVDIRMVLKTVGDITGINFVLDDSVHGNVTVMFPTKIRLAEVYKVLESILEV